MIVSYRANGYVKGIVELPTQVLGHAFNHVAHKLVSEGDLPADYGGCVRMEGSVKIDRKTYAAVSQAGLVVVQGGPDIPDRIELKS